MGEEEKGFTVKDRRFSTEKTDEAGNEEKQEAGPSRPAEQPAESEEKAAPESGTEPKGAGSPLPQINFSTFVFSLNSSALVHLGVIEDPGSGQKVKNLAFAKQTIDILGMLEEKTRGNLSGDEENLLKSMLHDLRLMYVREKQ